MELQGWYFNTSFIIVIVFLFGFVWTDNYTNLIVVFVVLVLFFVRALEDVYETRGI